ncbi:hypothetical protein [Paraglaciecola polaris]|uniref:Uncharacterized protein n=1 Tax=Paraglaciecola polaris LMG 21857 TaxID=1129793 RepID=K6YE86_9ALTE|nr:hypothetical protein [Paraglaciecola polaris]GAC31054.1 hypothetical protein GPLA_0133 [Paraglaciecola polaris LMG 21857]
MTKQKQGENVNKLNFPRLFKTDCPRCLRMRYIIIWGILMGLMYFGFWTE